MEKEAREWRQIYKVSQALPYPQWFYEITTADWSVTGIDTPRVSRQKRF